MNRNPHRHPHTPGKKATDLPPERIKLPYRKGSVIPDTNTKKAEEEGVNAEGKHSINTTKEREKRGGLHLQGGHLSVLKLPAKRDGITGGKESAERSPLPGLGGVRRGGLG